MSAITRITRTQLPDHDGSDILLYSDTGNFVGRLIFDGKGTTRFEQPPEQLPYRTLQSKAKRRQ